MRGSDEPVRLAGRLPGLDGVRGVAILSVMALHFVGNATPRSFAERIAVKVSSYGWLGVDLFFVLSGFLITGLLLDSKDRPHYFRNFYARRTLRIFPLYYFVLAVLFVVLPRVGEATPLLDRAREHQAWLWTYTSNFYVAARASWWALTYVSHFWSLAIEEHFYLVWPLLVFALSRRGVVRACVAGIVSALALRIVLTVAGVDELSISVLTPCRLDSLCLGGLLAGLCRGDQGAEPIVTRANALALASGTAILAVSLWCVTTHSGVAVLKTIRGSLFAVFFGALALISISPGAGALARLFRTRILRFFGKYSYGLYVYHGLATWYLLERGVRERIGALVGNHSLAIVATAALGSGASLLVAIASYELFEKRFLSLKRFFEAAEPPPEVAAAQERVSVA